MSLREWVGPYIASRRTSIAQQQKQRLKCERARLKEGRPHQVFFYYQATDPYSDVGIQLLNDLADSYQIELIAYRADAPLDADAPFRAELLAYAMSDADALASRYKLTPPSQLQGQIELYGQHFQNLPGPSVEERRRSKHRHFAGALWHYEGENYWYIDRLHYLTARLDELGLRKPDSQFSQALQLASMPPLEPPLEPPVEPPLEPQVEPPVSPTNVAADVASDTASNAASKSSSQNDASATPGKQLQQLDFYPSLRSPYTYLLAERLYKWASAANIKVNLKPVMPMMMRGVAASPEKQRYFVLDAKREATRHNLPFGKIADPFGKPVLRGLCLQFLALDNGLEQEYLLSFLRGVWAEGIRAGSDRGLKKIATRAGLAWADCQEVLSGSQSWQQRAEANRADLFKGGLWGVPTLHYQGLYVWGQDRLWRIAEKHQND